MTVSFAEQMAPVPAAELQKRLQDVSWNQVRATVLGYGSIGKEYARLLQAAGAQSIRVIVRSPKSLPVIQTTGLSGRSGGYAQITDPASPEDIAVVALPVEELVGAVDHLLNLGFKKILCEKPVALYSKQIAALHDRAVVLGADVICAYNRLVYPSFIEARHRASIDGGITSCVYTFTELSGAHLGAAYSSETLSRWGIANSLHVISMAHGLIGSPKTWNAERSGGLPWHPSGSVFVGSGLSERGIPFSYHADWESKGRWSVEFHTRQGSYRLCPLEKLFRKTVALGEWEEIPTPAFQPQAKPGFFEQLAALVNPDVRAAVPISGLQQAAELTRYAEDIFGYVSEGQS